jgi:transcriptional regulator with XRE-family HTH domain
MGAQSDREIVLKRVAANLSSVRRLLDVSQETLGVLAGLHRTEIGLLENAERIPRIDTVVKLATVLEIPVDQLVDGLTWEPPERVGEAGRFVAAAVEPGPDSPGSPTAAQHLPADHETQSDPGQS